MKSTVAITNAATIEVEGNQNKQASVSVVNSVVEEGNSGVARLLTNFNFGGGV